MTITYNITPNDEERIKAVSDSLMFIPVEVFICGLVLWLKLEEYNDLFI